MARPRKQSPRIYWRARGGGSPRAYGDFRQWKDVGGKIEPLRPQGATLATTDAEEAERLYRDRATELDRLRQKTEVLGRELGIARTDTLVRFAAEHLETKARSGAVTVQWLQVSEMHLGTATDFFGQDRELHTITVADVQRYAHWLARQPVRRGKARKAGDPPKPTLSPASQRKYLNTLSNLFREAAARELVTNNPVAMMSGKPVDRAQEAKWLEVHDAALLLEAARTWTPKRGDIALPFAYELVGTLLLTGGRESEVLGLEVDDVSFDRRTVTFRPNQWRRLKTDRSHRVVPMHPQLEEILRPYIFGGDAPRGTGLLFPAPRARIDPATGKRKVAMVTDWRKSLDAIAGRAGWKPGDVRSRQFRHTYCAARLQCLDRGAPIALYTVSRELGHSSPDLVEAVYSHLGTVRHRGEHVEYRVEQHREQLGDRLAALAGG
jgi:integrase